MTWEPEDAEIRRNALALHKAWRAAEKAYDESDESDDDLPPEGEAELRAADSDYFAKSGELRKEHNDKVEAIRAKYARPTPSLRSAADDAERAYMDAPGEAIREDDDGNAVICAKSGFPIFETDRIVEDPDSGEIFLRAATDLPPPRDEEDLEAAA